MVHAFPIIRIVDDAFDAHPKSPDENQADGKIYIQCEILFCGKYGAEQHHAFGNVFRPRSMVWLCDVQYRNCSWLNRHVPTLKSFISVSFYIILIISAVYLKTTPSVVHERIRKRARSEEQCVPLEYIEQLHDLHENWLVHGTSFKRPAPVSICRKWDRIKGFSYNFSFAGFDIGRRFGFGAHKRRI